MATIERVTPVGVDIRSFGAPWHIAGVTIDNPSGSWLTIPAINRYIPPYTTQWATNFIPSILSLDVLFTDSPSGSLSALVDGPVTVVISSEPVVESEGGPSGSGSKQATIPPSLTAQAAVATGVTSALISMVSNPTQRIVLRRLSLVPDLTAGLGAPVPFGSVVTALFELSGGGSGTPRWYLAISSESPFAEATFEDGTFTLPTGIDLDVTPIQENNGGKSYVVALAQYYLEIG